MMEMRDPSAPQADCSLLPGNERHHSYPLHKMARGLRAGSDALEKRHAFSNRQYFSDILTLPIIKSRLLGRTAYILAFLLNSCRYFIWCVSCTVVVL